MTNETNTENTLTHEQMVALGDKLGLGDGETSPEETTDGEVFISEDTADHVVV